MSELGGVSLKASKISGGSRRGVWGHHPPKIGQNLAKLAPFLPILASTPPLTDHPGSAPENYQNYLQNTSQIIFKHIYSHFVHKIQGGE